jgi:uncharacterized protein (TIGR03067 family)
MLTEPPGEASVRTSTYARPSDRPGWIDLTTVYEGKPDPLLTKAIYKIEEGRLTYCVAPRAKPRPTEFVTKNGDGYTLVELRRVMSK